MPRAGNRRKKTRTHVVENDAQNALVSNEVLKVPKSLIVRRGKVESEVSQLVDDLRKVMLPYTALNFKEDARNRKHTLSTYSKELALPMGVSHILAISQNVENVNLRLARVPEGPTMNFRVTKFSLVKNVRAVQRRPYSSKGIHQNSPIVVTNNFGDLNAPPHVKLMRITFQNMFPAINVATVKLNQCRRVVLFNYMEEDNMVELRHYAIKATPVGADRKVRRIVQTKIPNLTKLDDIADYITGTTASGNTAPSASTTTGNASDSEPEDETSHVVLAQKYSGRGNGKQQKSALKLVELGPRMSIKLLKVERGMGQGDVMYHALIKKTPEEVRELKERKEKEMQLKTQRRVTQEGNVDRKRQAKEEKLARKRQRREEHQEAAMDALRKGTASNSGSDNSDDASGSEGSSNADSDDSSNNDDDESDDSS